MRMVWVLFFCAFALSTTISAEEVWIVVTLDRIEFQGNLVEWPRFKGNPINFVSVVASGNSYQKLAWPGTGWYTIADEGAELVQDTEAIPLFALPLDRMGNRLGIAIQFLGNTDYDWDHLHIPEELSTLEKTLRRELSPNLPALNIPPSREREQEPLEWIEAPYVYFAPYIRVFSSDVWEKSDIRTFSAEVYQQYVVGGATPPAVRFRYSIRKVFLPEGLRARVRLEGIKTVENGDTLNGEVFLMARAISSFASTGRPLQRVIRIPSSGHYSMGDGEEKVLSAVLFEGVVSPFLYVEVMVWDEDNPGIGDQHDLLGGFFGLWLPFRLFHLPGGEKRLIIPKSTPDGEVLFYLRIELMG